MSFADEFIDKAYGAFIKLSPFASKIAITLFFLEIRVTCIPADNIYRTKRNSVIIYRYNRGCIKEMCFVLDVYRRSSMMIEKGRENV